MGCIRKGQYIVKLKVGTVFSGIGAFEQALFKMNIDFEIAFACDNGERYIDIDVESTKKKLANLSSKERQSFINELYDKTKKTNFVKQSYFANYEITEDRWFNDIRFITKDDIASNVDIFVGGSPCQSFSNIGKRAGLEDARGTLFYDFARLVKELQPKVFIFENVPGMLNHDKGNTWKIIRTVFDSLGYKIYFQVLDAVDFGIPQNRKRLFVVCFKNHDINFSFPNKTPLSTTVFDYLEDNVNPKYYLGQKGFEFVTNPKYRGRARINKEIICTEKANQQFNWNGDFIFEELDYKKHNPEILNRAYIGEWNNKVGVCRQLTHRECMRLMGFPDTYKIVVPNVPAYRQAGNSIVVNVLEAIMEEIIMAGAFNE